MSFSSKSKKEATAENKSSAEDKKAKKAAELEAKKAAKAEKAAEAKAKREAAIAKKKAAKKDKNGSKIEQDKSQLAKDFNIRISSPYGYYPDDVDPIIIDLQKQLSNLSIENQQLSKDNANLKKNNESLMTEITQLKLNAQLFSRPISMEESLIGLSKIDEITGNHTEGSPLDFAAGLLNDDGPAVNLEEPVKQPKKQIKLNLKTNKKGDN